MTQQAAPAATGSFCWYELYTRDIEAVKKFYHELFGWTTCLSDSSGHPYHHLQKGDEMFGGIIEMNAPHWGEIPSHWMTYVLADDVDALAVQAAKLGGIVCCAPTTIPNVGRFCVISDPAGPTLSLIHIDDPKPIPPVMAWNECMTRDTAKSADFYKALLGWEIEAMPMGDSEYLICKNNGEGIGGISEMESEQSGQAPPNWLNFIHTSQIDEDAARIPGLGGAIIAGPTDIPGNMGRYCVIADPGGGHIAMYQPAG